MFGRTDASRDRLMPCQPPPMRARVLAIAIIIALRAIAVTAASAQGAPEVPVLRIEPGMHAAAINDAAMDRAGTLMVTVSNDKTARAWTLPDLHPVRVLRPPIGPDQEGRLYAVAVSPDGTRAAVAGWLGRTMNLTVVDLFDLDTGKLLHRFPVDSTVHALAISSDGRLLAAGLADGGVRVWRLLDGAVQLRDRDYAGTVFGLDFAADGRLAVASFDGELRLYDDGLRLVQRKATEAGQRPFRLRFSPDGRDLAVGFADKAAVEVRSAADLSMRLLPDVSGLNARDLRRLAWSADGQDLFASAVLADGDSPVIAWGKHGAGHRRMVASGFHDRISSILPLKDDTLAVTSMDPAIAVFANGRPRASQPSPIADVKPWSGNDDLSRQLFSSSFDGGLLEMAGLNNYKHPLHIDIAALLVTQRDAPVPGLTRWQSVDGGLRVQGWFNDEHPRLNGRALALDAYEYARAVDVRNGRVLLGADRSLRLSNAEGQALWPRPVPLTDGAWRVVQSPDGRLAIAALGDGTIRWYRASDGTELLALFIHSDGKRWVAFTPGGYYAASPGGEDLIGWQVNNGQARAADWFPVSRFRQRFYRPDVIGLVLQTLDEAQAVQRANGAHNGTARLVPAVATLQQAVLDARPPVVTIISPREGTIRLDSDAAALEVEVRSPTGRPITRVEARLNGRPAPGAQIGEGQPMDAAPNEAAQRRHIVVPVPADEQATLQIIAWSDDRPSEAASVAVLGRPAPAEWPAAPGPKPHMWVLLAGVSAYSDPELQLRFAAKDAKDLAAALKKQANGIYGEVNIEVLADAKVTREAILQALGRLQRSTGPNDLVIMFLAGHGVANAADYYFLPFDAGHEDEGNSWAIKGISGSVLREALGSIGARMVVFLDTCYAGAAAQPDNFKLSNEFSSPETGVAFFGATSARQEAQELESLHNGVFTRALLDVLDGDAGRPSGGVIRTLILGDELAVQVAKVTGDKQKTTFKSVGNVLDDPLFIIRP
jgi:WD40 repeat protein